MVGMERREVRPVDLLPEAIGRFLDGNIESMEQLEILRILGDDPTREWSAADLAREVQTSPQVLASDLALLCARGFLTSVLRETMLFCRYSPRTPELEQSTGRLLQFYKERPVTLIRMVYARVGGTFWTFVDPFGLRKEG